ncbi:MAG: HPr family phosphocarrier protein [Nitrospina sp.]|jgi:phosphotransferase system HPr (HPr) family protein|nr:HPr family phosphocarrier protein [Nitrospina sp.]MBT3875861.1 HPr family phosphocarrier protein [Nitrospina sp.]MBT4049308.1 HPr family phosphocarrier protein [Nitrospina sp.]MBT4557276.1 HPr family phosphocarrier protein [Nitrospina sp.]MBT5347548.1 HPr family phosphocarrier protein [Nitrospina sp.]
MEAKSLIQIISEEEFLKIVQEPSRLFLNVSALLCEKIKAKKEISRKYYSTLIQETEYLESVLDEHGARENKTWSFFSEYVACIRNLSIAAFYIKHILDRYPYYNLGESEENAQAFHDSAYQALEFLNASILGLRTEVVKSGELNGLEIHEGSLALDEFSEIESNKRLPRTILEDEVKEEEERIIDLCQKYRKVAKMVKEIGFKRNDDLEVFRHVIPSKLDEKLVRMFKELVHSVQSEYDTYVKNTRLEQTREDLKYMRGYISMPLHLLEVVLWLCHFYERHEDDIRHGECRQQISKVVNKEILLGQIFNFGFHYSMFYLQEGDKLVKEILLKFVENVRAEVLIPQPLGFHARPSTFISLIARHHEGELFMIIDEEKFNAKSVMSLLQAGGLLADKGYKKVILEGSKQAINDVKLLAQNNYCEEGEFPRQLSYLRPQ